MRKWEMPGEPSLDELLGDEIMDHVTRAAGLDKSELRRRLAELARRLGDRLPKNGFDASRCCGAAVG
jgi:hypothetical protein